ncbi:hypothetical protein NUW54_g13698 [Trametes sanguinea]|uniref:Uncharacterized protein n=1 Tax=Trametes sanguinea TaxID=158606 RepID=A0ACC1MIF4_9APHY|nr:hypothetical protein NUW54_g13698 [Trametes sanguinea]
MFACPTLAPQALQLAVEEALKGRDTAVYREIFNRYQRAHAEAGDEIPELSALKSASITPVSALKDPSRNRLYTPANGSGHRRSVSFSDGKHDGPIRGIGRNLPTPEGSRPGDDDEDSPLALESRAEGGSAVLVPSARSRRIANMLDNLGDDGEPRAVSG